MKFVKVNGTIEDVLDKGFCDGDHIISLMSDGSVIHGRLTIITEYSTMFPVQITIDNSYEYKSHDVMDCLITKVDN